MHTTFMVLVFLCSWTYADYYTALSDMEPLLDTHRTMIDVLQAYIDKEKMRHKILKHYIKHYKEEHVKALVDIPSYLEDPVNCFTLIKRLTNDLEYLENTTNATSYLKARNIKYPTMEDFDGAALALARIHVTYELNVTELANGVLNSAFGHENKPYMEVVAPMTASDCFEAAISLMKSRDLKNGLTWMLRAYEKYPAEKQEKYPFNMADIIENICHVYHINDDIENSVKWMKKLQVLKPSDKFVNSYVYNFEGVLNDQEALIQKYKIPAQFKNKYQKTAAIKEDERVQKLYGALCRGEMKIPKEKVQRLKCRYLTLHHMFLKLAPIKMEQLYLEPEVILFYDVMSDREIEHLKIIAKPKLQSTVISAKKRVSKPYHTSKIAWFLDEQSDVVARMSRRVSHLTGLSVESAERLQVCNYGIGGHMVPHKDVIRMSEVTQGGATVFPELGLSVFPVRGAALFWRNLHPSGEEDPAIEYGGCPVLRGDKWVANKWFTNVVKNLDLAISRRYQKSKHNLPGPLKNRLN